MGGSSKTEQRALKGSGLSPGTSRPVDGLAMIDNTVTLERIVLDAVKARA